MAKKLNRLSSFSSIRLADYLRSGEVELQGKTAAQVAEQATEDIGFYVTDNNVVSLIGEGIIPDFRPDTPRQSANNQMDLLNRRVAQLENRYEVLNAAKNALSERIGMLESAINRECPGMEDDDS